MPAVLRFSSFQSFLLHRYFVLYGPTTKMPLKVAVPLYQYALNSFSTSSKDGWPTFINDLYTKTARNKDALVKRVLFVTCLNLLS